MSEYDVVLLVEEPFSITDATNVRSLHDGIEEPVRYHVLMPVEDASARVETAMGSLANAEMLAPPAVPMDPEDFEGLREELVSTCRAGLDETVRAIESVGGRATGEPVTDDPVRALADKVTELDAREVIIVTRPHVVSEFFHVDWTSRARRKLGVPVLHLLEHENFDEQAGEGEGISGF